MALPDDRRRSFLARQVGTLALSHLRVDNPMAPVRAAGWFNTISRLGVHLPLFVVHDVGQMFTASRSVGGSIIAPRADALARIAPPPHVRGLLEEYGRLLVNIAESEVVEKAAGWRLRDDLVAVLLTRALGDVYTRWRDQAKAAGVYELPMDPGLYADNDVAALFREFDPGPIYGFLEHLIDMRMHVYTSVELIDLDTLKLLGLFRDDTANGADAIGSAVDLVDLFTALGSPEANDVANFSLELLPSVLETKRASGVQTFSIDGYASLERRGNVDSLVLSEMAYDREVFEQKVVNNELLYYGHEQQREEERWLQYIMVDSSASMRGKRQVFARGLALTLVKKLSLQGDEIWLRFFDSRLHELIKVARGAQFPVPYVLSFRSERGRNYAKVFRQLLLEVSRLKRDQRRKIVLYIITHGECHIATELIAALGQHAYLYGIIILPSSEVSLDFLPLLDRYQIVESTSLRSRAERRDRALDIVGEASHDRAEAHGPR